jgi:hypothetical protein
VIEDLNVNPETALSFIHDNQILEKLLVDAKDVYAITQFNRSLIVNDFGILIRSDKITAEELLNLNTFMDHAEDRACAVSRLEVFGRRFKSLIGTTSDSTTIGGKTATGLRIPQTVSNIQIRTRALNVKDMLDLLVYMETMNRDLIVNGVPIRKAISELERL